MVVAEPPRQSSCVKQRLAGPFGGDSSQRQLDPSWPSEFVQQFLELRVDLSELLFEGHSRSCGVRRLVSAAMSVEDLQLLKKECHPMLPSAIECLLQSGWLTRPGRVLKTGHGRMMRHHHLNGQHSFKFGAGRNLP